jgi:hypothetical protein
VTQRSGVPQVASLEERRNTVFQKIGRNLVVFQELERVLKLLAKVRNLSFAEDDTKSTVTQRLGRMDKKTLGHLAKEVRSYFSEKSESETEIPTSLARLSVSFRIETESNTAKAIEISLSELVEGRNELVHHLLARFDLKSLESCSACIEYLDVQLEHAGEELRRYTVVAKNFLESLRAVEIFLDSDGCGFIGSGDTALGCE